MADSDTDRKEDILYRMARASTDPTIVSARNALLLLTEKVHHDAFVAESARVAEFDYPRPWSEWERWFAFVPVYRYGFKIFWERYQVRHRRVSHFCTISEARTDAGRVGTYQSILDPDW